MFRKIFNYIIRPKQNNIDNKKNRTIILDFFLKEFINSPHHLWILENKYLVRAFTTIIEKLDNVTLQKLISNDKKLTFIQATGRLSCALSSMENSHIIIIFPDLYKILISANPDRGVAILLHEIAHLALDHSYKIIDPMVAQLEADKFTANLGYGHFLKEILEEFPDNQDCKDRIKSIQTYI